MRFPGIHIGAIISRKKKKTKIDASFLYHLINRKQGWKPRGKENSPENKLTFAGNTK